MASARFLSMLDVKDYSDAGRQNLIKIQASRSQWDSERRLSLQENTQDIQKNLNELKETSKFSAGSVGVAFAGAVVMSAMLGPLGFFLGALAVGGALGYHKFKEWRRGKEVEGYEQDLAERQKQFNLRDRSLKLIADENERRVGQLDAVYKNQVDRVTTQGERQYIQLNEEIEAMERRYLNLQSSTKLGIASELSEIEDFHDQLDLARQAFDIDSGKLFAKFQMEQKFIKSERKILTGEYEQAEFAKDIAATQIVSDKVKRSAVEVTQKTSGQTARDSRALSRSQGIQILAEKFAADSQLAYKELQISSSYSKALLRLSGKEGNIDKLARSSQLSLDYDSKKLKNSLLRFNSNKQSQINKNIFDIRKLNQQLSFAAAERDQAQSAKSQQMALLLDSISQSVHGLQLDFGNKLQAEYNQLNQAYITAETRTIGDLYQIERNVFNKELALTVGEGEKFFSDVKNFTKDYVVGPSKLQTGGGSLNPNTGAGK